MSTPTTRIAYIGNFRAPHSTENHVLRSLRSIDGVLMVCVQEDEIPNWSLLPPQFQRDGVDLALWTHTHGMADESNHVECSEYLAGMRDEGITTVGYHLDRWWGLEREAQVHEPFFRQDIVVTADGGHAEEWAALDINHVWMPPAIVHDEIGRGTVQARYRKDVGFVGGWHNYGHVAAWPWRYEMIVWLNKNYGNRFRAWPRGAAIRGRELNDLYASVKVIVGDSCLAAKHNGDVMTHYWSDRIPETLGRGGILLHPHVEGLDEQFPIDLPIRFHANNRVSLRDAIERALALDDDEREGMITEAMNFVRSRHTYRVRMGEVIRLAKEFRDGHVGGTQSDGGGPEDASTQRVPTQALAGEPETVRLESSLHVTTPRDPSIDDDRAGER